MITHAAIVPLIGGIVLSSSEVFGKDPEYILSYSSFKDNEKHLLNYYKQQGKDIQYQLIDENPLVNVADVDVVSALCPCAGLSTCHNSYGEHNRNNDWMKKTCDYVLEKLRPKVFWGENAANLASVVGKFMRKYFSEAAEKNGYLISIYKTKTIYHGNPQVRTRTFYFFWRKDVFPRIPIFHRYNRKRLSAYEFMANFKSNHKLIPINKDIPSEDDLLYRLLLDEVKMSHSEFALHVFDKEKNNPDYSSIVPEKYMLHELNLSYKDMSDRISLMDADNDRTIKILNRKHHKISNKLGNVMTRGTTIPINKIEALVLHLPKKLTHPIEDRYVSVEECLYLMGMPRDFELLDPDTSINHICQNVPYNTAKDMAIEVKESLLGNRQLESGNLIIQSNINGSIVKESETPIAITEFFE